MTVYPTVSFDDLKVGQTFKTGTYKVTKDEIIAFAKQYDPQVFHTDEEAAKKTFFKGLVASGWHTLSLSMRLMVDAKPYGDTPLVGMGGDTLRFSAPVYPDDELHVEAEIKELRPSSKDNTRGYGLVELVTYANGEREVARQNWRMLIPR